MTDRITLSFDNVKDERYAEMLACNEKKVGIFALCSLGNSRQDVANHFDCTLAYVAGVVDEFNKAGVKITIPCATVSNA